MSNNNKFSLYAFICFAFISLLGIVNFIKGLKYGFYFFSFLFILFEIGLAVTTLLRKKIILISVAGVGAVLELYDLMYGVIGEYHFFSWYDFTFLLSFLSLLVLVVLSMKGSPVVSKVWFVPGLMMLIHMGVSFLSEFSYFKEYGEYLNYGDMIRSCIEIFMKNAIFVLGLVLVGLWLKGELDSPNVENKYSDNNPPISPVASNTDVFGNADRLRECKTLLDEGLITQEEFEEKKKQILG